MDLLVAHGGDPAGSRMAASLAAGMGEAGAAPGGRGSLRRGDGFDLLVIDTPAVSADWLADEEGYGGYGGFVFLSRHSAASGIPALTCHSTGNVGPASLGGREGEVAVPYPALQKSFMRMLWERRGEFPGFEVTIEATHHGPTALDRPVAFVEVGTTEREWRDDALCGSVAGLAREAVAEAAAGPSPRFGICFGGPHYSRKFTDEAARGEFALGTVVPRRALALLDEGLLSHILERNAGASAALVDDKGLGARRREVLGLLEGTGLEVIRL